MSRTAKRDESVGAERQQALLHLCLGTAVPLWIERLQRWPWAEVQARAEVLGFEIASTGDALQFSCKPGEMAKAFNKYAEALGCLAFGPGGVAWCGLHFEAHHPDSPRPEESIHVR